MTLTPSAVSAHSPLDMSRAKYRGVLPDRYYDEVAQCETNHKIGQDYETRSYTSPLGIAKMTAHRWSGRRNLNGLTPRQLVNVADRIAFLGWTKKNGEHIWRVGPFGWGVVRNGCMHTLDYICQSKHPKVTRYNSRACRLLSNS